MSGFRVVTSAVIEGRVGKVGYAQVLQLLCSGLAAVDGRVQVLVEKQVNTCTYQTKTKRKLAQFKISRKTRRGRYDCLTGPEDGVVSASVGGQK